MKRVHGLAEVAEMLAVVGVCSLMLSRAGAADGRMADGQKDEAATTANGQQKSAVAAKNVFGPNVEFGVVPFPMPQFGVVPDATGRTIYNSNPVPAPAAVPVDARRYYNGYTYPWPAPQYAPPPLAYYGRPGYSGPLSPAPNGFVPPWVTALPSGGYYSAYPNYGCTPCPPAYYPYPTYPAYPAYPSGYYPDGYYNRDARSTYGGLTVGGGNFQVTIGGSRTTTQSSSNTTVYGGRR
jgi:hypothetical protein